MASDPFWRQQFEISEESSEDKIDGRQDIVGRRRRGRGMEGSYVQVEREAMESATENESLDES